MGHVKALEKTSCKYPIRRVEVEIHFAEALAGTINVVLYAEFDNEIEIDRNRQVLFDYSA